jgi:two-component system LytT family response regulator
MRVRTLIVDDMPLAREKLKRLLESDREIQIVGECSDGHAAVKAIGELAPDLLLLDVQMPELDGFGVLQQVSASSMPVVIFVTAYDQFALKAFEVHALGYLLKPIDEERLMDALSHAKAQIRRRRAGEIDLRLRALLESVNAAPKYIKRLVIRSTGRVVFLQADEIDWIESAGNYVAVHVGRQTHLLRESLSQLESRLAPERFVRIHRSTIVNIERIKELQHLTNGDQRAILGDGKQLTVSRGYREKLMEALESPS